MAKQLDETAYGERIAQTTPAKSTVSKSDSAASATGVNIIQPDAPVVKEKTLVEKVDNGDGTFTLVYDDSSKEIIGTQKVAEVVKAKVVSTYTDPATGDIIDVYDDETEKVRKKGTVALDAANAAATAAEERRRAGQSAYDIIVNEFNQYGLGSLVEPLKNLIVTGASPAEFTIELRKSEPYKKRFAANAQRVAAGLKALDEADYIALEDQYQNIMRNYGLPSTYWAKDAMGTQEGFTKLIAGDVSATELESRVQQASDIIDKSPTEYIDAIKQFYPEVQRGDLMAYVLDPKNGLSQIQTKIGAAKIGGEYLRAGLGQGSIDMASAEDLARQGVTAEKARAGAQAIKETAPRGSQLAALYGQGPYGMQEVEAEVYGLGNAAEAKRKREKINELEQAQFSRRTGNISTALSRNTEY